MTITLDFGGVLGRPLDIMFWALTILWSGSWLIFEVGLSKAQGRTSKGCNEMPYPLNAQEIRNGLPPNSLLGFAIHLVAIYVDGKVTTGVGCCPLPCGPK